MRIGRTMIAAGVALAVGAALGAHRTKESSVARHSIGWFARSAELLRASVVGAFDDGILTVAAAISYYALLSMVPALSVLISVYGLLTAPTDIPGQLVALDLPVPVDLRVMIAEQAARLATAPKGTLSLAFLISLGLAVWSANAAVKAMFDGLDRMWDLAETRSFLRLNGVTIAFTVVSVLTIAAMLAAFALLPAFVARIGDGEAPRLLALLRWPVMLVLVFATLVTLYRFGPDRAPPSLALQVPGAAIATTAWIAISAGFSWYAAALGSYSATYGSLAGVVVVLTWSWLSSIVVLLGGEISVQIERRAARGP